eukprot:gene2055-1498_t
MKGRKKDEKTSDKKRGKSPETKKPVEKAPKIERQLPDDFLEDRVADVVVDEEYYATALDGKSIEEWMQRELLHSKSQLNDVTWGKRVIHAIDFDDAIKIGQLMDPKQYPHGDINLQVTTRGYAEYLWTPKIHQFVGETALHMALRQRKLYATYMLLYLGADPTIVSGTGVSAAELCMRQFHTSHQNLKFDAKRKLLEKLNPLRWKELPADFYCRHTEEEAWRLMRAGRMLYTELPKALQQEQHGRSTNAKPIISHNARKRLSFNLTYFKPPPAPKEKRERPQDVKLRKRQEALAEQQRQEQALIKSPKKAKYNPWRPLQAEDGSTYYYNEETGESSWDRPAQSEAGGGGDDDDGAAVAVAKELTPEELELARQKKEHEEMALQVHSRLLDYYKVIGHEETIPDDSGYTMGGLYHPAASTTRQHTAQKPLKLLVSDVWHRGTLDDILRMIRQQQAYHQSLKQRRALHLPHHHHGHHSHGLHAIQQQDNPLEDGAIGQTQLDRLLYYRRLISGMLPSHEHETTQDLDHVHAHYPRGHTEEQQKIILHKFASLDEIFQTMRGMERLSLVVQNTLKPTATATAAATATATAKAKASVAETAAASKTEAIQQLKSFAQAERAKWIHDQQRVEDHRRKTMKATQALQHHHQQHHQQHHHHHHHHHHQQQAGAAGHAPHLHVHLHHRPVRVLSTYLNLRFFSIGDAGAIALCQTLAQDELVHTLILANARLTDACSPAIQQLIHTHNETLTYLDLSGNALTSDGVKTLAEGIFKRRLRFSPEEQQRLRMKQRRQQSSLMLQSGGGGGGRASTRSPFASPSRRTLPAASPTAASVVERASVDAHSSLEALVDERDDVLRRGSIATTHSGGSGGGVVRAASAVSRFVFDESLLAAAAAAADPFGDTNATMQPDPASEETITLMKAPIHRLNLMGNRITLEGALAVLEAVLQYNRRIYETNASFVAEDAQLLEKERLQDRYHRGGIDWVNLSNNALSPQDHETLAKWMEEHDYAAAAATAALPPGEDDDDGWYAKQDEPVVSRVVGVRDLATLPQRHRPRRDRSTSRLPGNVRVFAHRDTPVYSLNHERIVEPTAMTATMTMGSTRGSTMSPSFRASGGAGGASLRMRHSPSVRTHHRRVLSTKSVKDHLHASLHETMTSPTPTASSKAAAAASSRVAGSPSSKSAKVTTAAASAAVFQSSLSSMPAHQPDYRKQWQPTHRYPVVLL